jgi:hypothetical protein
MLNAQDQEKVVKASQTANLLAQDIHAIVKSENLLLVELAMEMLQQVVALEQKLKRIASFTAPSEP